ncbi:MAG: D-alanyl-D-alanine carboxypeptidase [Clostridia bacterium]|nr:D-alanyl-D-alanine carboxypeptidase [Clostridia bacterium]
MNKKLKFLCTFTIITVFVIFAFVNVYAQSYIYPVSSSTYKPADQSSISTDANADIVPEFNFKSVAQVLMEPVTGKVIYAKNEHEKLLPASVTKVMSLILIMEQIDGGRLKYTDTVTCSATASKLGGSQIWFREGEKLTIDEAVKCIAVASANDVTTAMAEMIGGSEQNFVKMMNAKAKELGMNDTTFLNCHGLDQDGHVTSAYDIALMSRELINKHPDIFKYTSIWMDSIRGGTFGLTNTNKLIRFYDGAIGLKTGSTSLAGFNLSAVAKKENSMFIAVVMKAPTGDIRNEETKQLLDYAFSNYQVKNICSTNTVIENISINKHVNAKIEIKNISNLSILISKGSDIETTQTVEYIDDLKAPIEKDSIVGKIYIKNKKTGETVGQSDLYVTEKIEKSKLMDYYGFMIKKYIMKI